MDLNLEFMLVHTLATLVHVQDRRLIVLRERILQVVCDQTSFTDCCVTTENQLDLIGATKVTTTASISSFRT